MKISRRDVMSTAFLAFSGSLPSRPAHARAPMLTGNPLKLPAGVCDPHVRVYDGTLWLYATHDASPSNQTFTMNDWQIWRSADLRDWSLAGTLRPEQTYFGRASTQCWATDAARKNGRYYVYFSMGPEEIGVVASESPAGPWHDPIGRPLIAKGQVRTEARDPGILQDEDGSSYIVFGTFDYYIARLAEDMVSLAEPPRLIEISDKEGPYGRGQTDDKPYLHRRGDIYYLSWGSYYAMGSSPYGPFQCKGALLRPQNVDETFLFSTLRSPHAPQPEWPPKNWLNYDRHASFFGWRGRWFFMCNDQSQPDTSYVFRRSVICEVHYLSNGDIAPLRLRRRGVQHA